MKELLFICIMGLLGLVIVLLKVCRSFFGWKAALEKSEMEKRLIAEFRSIAAEPVPAKSDPRFKGWDGMKRLSENRPLRWWR